MPVIYGNAIKLVAASSQYVVRTRVSTATDNITVAFWIYIDAYPSATKTIFENGDVANHTGYRITLTTGGILTCDMIFVDASAKLTNALSTGQWYHIIMEKASGTTSFYVNSVQDGPTSSSSWNGLAADSQTGLGAAFNNSASPVAASFTDITVDDLRYYNRAVSAGERLSLYNYGLNINNGDISNANLVLWWKFNELNGATIAIDGSGNGNSGTIGGAAQFVQGKVISRFNNAPILLFADD